MISLNHYHDILTLYNRSCSGGLLIVTFWLWLTGAVQVDYWLWRSDFGWQELRRWTTDCDILTLVDWSCSGGSLEAAVVMPWQTLLTVIITLSTDALLVLYITTVSTDALPSTIHHHTKNWHTTTVPVQSIISLTWLSTDALPSPGAEALNCPAYWLLLLPLEISTIIILIILLLV